MRESRGGISWESFSRFNYLVFLHLNAQALEHIERERAKAQRRTQRKTRRTAMGSK